VGARPNFIKIAPIMEAIDRYNDRAAHAIDQLLVHTGQHYDEQMSKVFFDELRIPRPHINLEVGSGSHAEQTAEIIRRFEKVCLEKRPSHVLVVGDVNSTIACALVAAKMGIRIIHVEAGLRSFDRSMPEEINRILTDQIADYLFVTEKSGVENLAREGVPRDKIFLVGNVMIDTLLKHKEQAQHSNILSRLGLRNGQSNGGGHTSTDYCVMTLHRPANVDDKKQLEGILDALAEISKRIITIFPVHPRTIQKIKEYSLGDRLEAVSNGEAGSGGLRLIGPLPYLDFLCLLSNAKLVMTDSGGIQEETTVLGVPCLTLRENTERPVTVTDGTNIIVGTKKTNIVRNAYEVLNASQNRNGFNGAGRKAPPLWDGSAAERIVYTLASLHQAHPRSPAVLEIRKQ
jgi:UDP-N-acetylglucosamine 2-epimerase (non-hydrolysing)